MSNTIAKLWNGEIAPVDRCGWKEPEMQKLMKLMYRNYEKLEQRLDKPTQEILEAYAECADDYGSAANEQAFCEGFRLGVKLTAEALL